jgi:hypothetical protein
MTRRHDAANMMEMFVTIIDAIVQGDRPRRASSRRTFHSRP